MITEINGLHFYSLIDYGTRNLSIHKERVNSLNVFPVPDGDTGTNMLITLKNGLSAVEESFLALSRVAKPFSRAVVLGARGNSGVIVSQFFKGISEPLTVLDIANTQQFVQALQNGVKLAYLSVPDPVEGTILTVVREAVDYVVQKMDGGQICCLEDVIDAFLEKAQQSLADTPMLLPELKAANVVDSGGAGIVYVFEGMKKYLMNEPLPKADHYQSTSVGNFAAFNRESRFEYGYCTEVLLQLVNGKEAFEQNSFLSGLAQEGNSLVLAVESDKVKIHIHTFHPENVLTYCHRFGEFLSMKIDNMSVQHQELFQQTEIPHAGQSNPFSIVAVAHNVAMETYFREMGADVIIRGSHKELPSTLDFINAFRSAPASDILVFPNNKNTKLTAQQAKALFDEGNIHIMNTHSDAECYAVLPMVDFSCEDSQEMAEQIGEAIDHVQTVFIAKAAKNVTLDDMVIKQGSCIASADNRVFASGSSLEKIAVNALSEFLGNMDCEIVTVFTAKTVPESIRQSISGYVAENYPLVECHEVDNSDEIYPIIFAFE